MQTNHKWPDKSSKELFKAILALKNEQEAVNFFRDLCTLEELAEMARRWQSVIMLNQGKSYRDIADKTGLSTTTVTRVAHWLNYGQGGYKLILKRIK